MADLVNRARIKRMLGIPTGITQQDALIDMVMVSARDIVLGHCELTSTDVTTYNEKIDVTNLGQTEVALTHRPVVAVAALTIGGSLEATADYYVTEWGSVRLIPVGAYFPEGRQKVEVCYTAGFGSDIPKDLEHATTMIAVQMVNEGAHAGYKTERMGGYSYTMNDGQYNMIVRRILAKYSRVFARP